MRGAAAGRRPAAEVPETLHGRTAGDAMVRRPRVLDERATVADVLDFFADDHLHAALVVDADRRLLAVVDQADLEGHEPGRAAREVGRLAGRTVDPAADLVDAWWSMREAGRRRLAVVDPESTLLGLLCLKASGLGFCSDADVDARRAEGDGWTGC